MPRCLLPWARSALNPDQSEETFFFRLVVKRIDHFISSAEEEIIRQQNL